MRLQQYIYSIIILIIFSCGPKKAELQPEAPLQIRVGAYNVEVSRNASAKEIGMALKAYNFDVICFSEAPGGNWTEEVARYMGLSHFVVGKYSTAGHEDKYKTIASKTALYGAEEILMADTLHTVTKAMTKIGEQQIGIYSVHFPFGWRDQAHIDETTGKVTAFVDYLKNISKEEIPMVMGDFNFIPSNPDKENAYHNLFKGLGLAVHWKDLEIDPRNINTHNALKPEDEGSGKTIDHIMYNPIIFKATEGGIVPMEKPLSDHKAVWALLELQ
jgi:endonuclease/exonuclease/phosphatase family metal-dependent hydrolase